MKTITRVVSAAGLLAATAVLCALAKNLPIFFFSFWEKASLWLLGVLDQAFGWVPFAVWELFAVLFAVWFVASLCRAIVKFRVVRWLSGVLWGVALGAFLFVFLWGAGHFGADKTSTIVTVTPPSAAELRDAAVWYGARASEEAAAAPRSADGSVVMPSVRELSEILSGSYAALSERYPALPTAAVRAKPLLGGKLFSYLGLTGMFVPFTAEATVNPETYAPSLPHTVAHELAHRLGACSEEDANFLAFLACAESEGVALRYSADYSAFLYCYNALYDLSPEEASAVWATLGSEAQRDLDGATAHYAPYEGSVQNAAQRVNDTYLKAFDEQGIASYGLVSDALVAWYRAHA